MKYLVDTCVISETFKPNPDPKVLKWIDACAEDSVFISVLTIGELQKGISKLPNSQKKQLMQHWLDVDFLQRFAGRIIEIDEDVVSLWGAMLADKEKKGVNIPAIDSLIAATALANGLVVVTRNTKDFEKCGVKILDPFNFSEK